MTLFNKISDLLQSVRSWVSGLVLAIALVSGSQDVTAQPVETIKLNTGLVGQAGSTLIPFLKYDDDWRVTVDPINPTPRPPYVVTNIFPNHFKWPAPLLNSRWISGRENWYAGTMPKPPTRFAYQFCFDLPLFFSAAKLEMQLRADDIVRRVRLNGTILYDDPDPDARASTSKPGSFRGPPLSIKSTTGFLTGRFKGRDCLEVVVEDTDGFVSGLNVVGTVTYRPKLFEVGPPWWGIVAGTTFCLPGIVEETDLSTGTTNGFKNAPGAVDPKWQLIGVPTGNPGRAFSTSNHLAWVPNSLQQPNWIQRDPSGNPQNDSAGQYTYRVQFPVTNPSQYSIELTFRYAADDTAVVRLNNSPVDGCAPNCFAKWRPTLTLRSPGTNFLPNNNLDVIVTNNGLVTGLIVDAKLRLTCI